MNLGWTAQSVIYDQENNMHIGAQRLGADVAEKEALAWSAFWRLSQNWSIPTCFRSDSRTALGQACGTVGASTLEEETFTLLRGAHQAVEAALGSQGVLYDHVPGHAGEMWNEICDWLAKKERERSFYCPRPRLGMRKWRQAIGHLWMVVSPHPDLPRFTGQGLAAPPPNLPLPADEECQRRTPSPPTWHAVDFRVSMCTANVNSMSRNPDGYGGKVDYIRRQFKEQRLNFLGLQETKAPEICSCVDGIYRLGGGCAQHQQGVELWINLHQPYAYARGRPCFFEKGDFQIVHKDSRILMVRVETFWWKAWLVVAYAPHSGIAFSDREAWWQSLSDLLFGRQQDEPLFIMIDANAAPGVFDGEAVHCEGLPSSSSTPLLRQVITEHALHMPCTTDAHQGQMHTWTNPSGTDKFCIDYVLIPLSFSRSCTLSKVIPDFDLGLAHWDHEPTAVEMQWREWMARSFTKALAQRTFDHNKLSKETVRKVLTAYEPAQWHVDIETQVSNFNEQNAIKSLQRMSQRS